MSNITLGSLILMGIQFNVPGLIHYTLGGIGCTWAFIISRILVLTYFLPSEASICVYPGRGPKIRGLLRHFTNELLLCSNFVSKMTK